MSADELSKIRQQGVEIYEVLVDTYGEPERRDRGDAVGELVRTILSQNTSDHNSDRAFQSLKDAFPNWDAVLHAPSEEVADAIRYGGLAEQKAPRIQGALQRILEETGEFSLDFLRGMSVDEARDWLTSIKGIGPKTASVVLLFSLKMPAFPVDTHVHRVSTRLGLVPKKASPERTSEIFEETVPEDLYYAYHILLIRHGRETCHARNPECQVCTLASYCDYYANVVAG